MYTDRSVPIQSPSENFLPILDGNKYRDPQPDIIQRKSLNEMSNSNSSPQSSEDPSEEGME